MTRELELVFKDLNETGLLWREALAKIDKKCSSLFAKLNSVVDLLAIKEELYYFSFVLLKTKNLSVSVSVMAILKNNYFKFTDKLIQHYNLTLKDLILGDELKGAAAKTKESFLEIYQIY